MRFLISPDVSKTPTYRCFDLDHPDGPQELGIGTSPDEALGQAVREAWLSGTLFSVEDIIIKERPQVQEGIE